MFCLWEMKSKYPGLTILLLRCFNKVWQHRTGPITWVKIKIFIFPINQDPQRDLHILGVYSPPPFIHYIVHHMKDFGHSGPRTCYKVTICKQPCVILIF